MKFYAKYLGTPRAQFKLNIKKPYHNKKPYLREISIVLFNKTVILQENPRIQNPKLLTRKITEKLREKKKM